MTCYPRPVGNAEHELLGNVAIHIMVDNPEFAQFL